MKRKMVWALVLLAIFVCSGCDPWPPENPPGEGTVTGPVHGGINEAPFMATQIDLEKYGYIEEEFFMQGDATAYRAQGELGIDGHWGALPTIRKKPYKTRLLVRRPVDPAVFNGTVIVEWLNVTGGIDADVGFHYAWTELLRGGYGYVGVSVQKAGVDGGNVMSRLLANVSGQVPLTQWDPERYGSLDHPGDLYCYDIFTQAGEAIARPGTVDPMLGLKVERLIAYGQSQSAMRMITYVNAVHPMAKVFDGFFIQSRAGWGAAIGNEADPLLGNGNPVHVREDMNALVLQYFTESELFLPLGPSFAARQPDNEHLRTWEVAGTAHADQYLLDNISGDATSGCGDTGKGPAGCGMNPDGGCGGSIAINNGPSHIVVKAGIRAMHLWLKEGKAPPMGTPLAVNAEQSAIARDSHGNALGGIRTPAVDVPIATFNGGKTTGGDILGSLLLLSGSTTPFESSQLRELYPTHQDYLDKVTAAAHEAGFVLPEEENTIIAEAIAAPIPE